MKKKNTSRVDPIYNIQDKSKYLVDDAEKNGRKIRKKNNSI